ncbi:MAG: DUF535 family protein [Paracoccaceae bacterium]
MALVQAPTLLRIAEQTFPGRTLANVKLKAKMLAAAQGQKQSIKPFLEPEPDTMLARVMAQRPEMLGALIWPYQCASWKAETRLNRIAAHYQAVDAIGGPYCFDLDDQLVVVTLDEQHAGLRVVLDQPKWFMREGGLTVNLFVGDFRAFSLAFSLWPTDQGLVGVIGGLQGRNREDALDLYRQLTKDLHGLRPRDFLLDIFRMLARRIGVQELHAVAQAQRHHLHPFFGAKLGDKELNPNYDAIWTDRGGVQLDADFWRLDVAPEIRDIETVKPKKRSLYRKRFAFLDAFEAAFAEGLDTAQPTRFVDT